MPPAEPAGQAFERLPGRFAIARLPASAAIPGWATGPFFSITRTPDELSIIAPEPAVPAGVTAEPGWVALRLRGPFAFSAVGVLASFLGPLAAAGIPILAVSTFDTDVVLVKEGRVAAAIQALVAEGHRYDVTSSA